MRAAFNGLVALDDRLRADHCYLTAADQCCYLAEYLSGRGYRAGLVNQLIVNLKCPPSAASVDPRRRRYKQRTIDEIAGALRAAVSRSSVESATWILVPPSRPARDADNDDRLRCILAAAFAAYELDLRPMLCQSDSTQADHTGARRLTADALYRVIGLDRRLGDWRRWRRRWARSSRGCWPTRWRCCSKALLPAASCFAALGRRVRWSRSPIS